LQELNESFLPIASLLMEPKKSLLKYRYASADILFGCYRTLTHWGLDMEIPLKDRTHAWGDNMVPNRGNSNAISLMTAVNRSEMKISNNPVETLVAFSIGSGMGVTVHDPVCGVGGILNFMLPDSCRANGVNPARVPFMFADTGIPAFLEALYARDARRDRLKVVVAGGAHILDQSDAFNIGQKNLEALKAVLDAHNLNIYHENTGGTNSKTLSLEIWSGCSSIKIFGEGEETV
jgi:chemotaxis protein CheD